MGRPSATIWVDVVLSGGGIFYIVESAILNSDIMEAHVRPAVDAHKGSAMRDHLPIDLSLLCCS